MITAYALLAAVLVLLTAVFVTRLRRERMRRQRSMDAAWRQLSIDWHWH